MFLIEPRPKKQVIADGEWHVTIQLALHGNLLGEPVTLRYGDAYLAGQPDEVGRLIATAMNEMALRRKAAR